MTNIYWFNPYASCKELAQDKREFAATLPGHQLHAFQDIERGGNGLVENGPFDVLVTAIRPSYGVSGIALFDAADYLNLTAPRFAIIPYTKDIAEEMLKDRFQVRPTLIETRDLFVEQKPANSVFVNVVRDEVLPALRASGVIKSRRPKKIYGAPARAKTADA